MFLRIYTRPTATQQYINVVEIDFRPMLFIVDLRHRMGNEIKNKNFKQQNDDV